MELDPVVSGLAQVSSYVDSSTFSQLRLADGEDASTAQAKLTIAKPATTYTTPPLTVR